MTDHADTNSPSDPDELIAYLDGEVDAEVRRQIELRLAEDPELMQRMREHQQAWDLLDELPTENASTDFTETTLEMVAVAASREVEVRSRGTAQRRFAWGGMAAASLLIAGLVGYTFASRALQRSDEELLRDLPVIENLDALQQVEDVEFLFALENEGLFVEENNNDAS